MGTTVASMINETRRALSEPTDEYFQDYHILKTICNEILNLENWLSLNAPEWLNYYTTESISVTQGTFTYALSSSKIFHRARATYTNSDLDHDLTIGSQGASDYWIERIGENILIHPKPYENFTLVLYERQSYETSLPTKYLDDLTDATTPKGFPSWALSYMQARVNSAVAAMVATQGPVVRISRTRWATKFMLLQGDWAQIAQAEQNSLYLHAQLQRPVQSTIIDTGQGITPRPWWTA